MRNEDCIAVKSTGKVMLRSGCHVYVCCMDCTEEVVLDI
jgi:hypothetical protein